MLPVAKRLITKSLVINSNKLRARNFQTSCFVRGIEEFKDVKTADANALVRAGRAWGAPELRRKSFDDLHKLWYVLYKERNVLLTMREKYRYAERATPMTEINRYTSVKRSMAAIKLVLAERRKFKSLFNAESEAN